MLQTGGEPKVGRGPEFPLHYQAADKRLSRNMRREHAVMKRHAGKNRCVGYIVPLVCWFALFATPVAAFPVRGSQTVLPAGTELNEDALDRPGEVFHSEAMGVALFG